MNTYYIVEDDEGIWLTGTPSPTDIIVHQTTDHSEAERALCLAIQRSQ
jgi:hypothetical protein